MSLTAINKTDALEVKFEEVVKGLKAVMDSSYGLFNENPVNKDAIIKLWKNNLKEVAAYAYKMSEEKNGAEIYKGIVKAMMF